MVTLGVITAMRYYDVMIKSFRGKAAAAIFERRRIKGVPLEISRQALLKLRVLDSVDALEELRQPPGNHLEALKGDRAGQYSIRVNKRWRLCFVWTGSDAEEVELVDYH